MTWWLRSQREVCIILNLRQLTRVTPELQSLCWTLGDSHEAVIDSSWLRQTFNAIEEKRRKSKLSSKGDQVSVDQSEFSNLTRQYRFVTLHCRLRTVTKRPWHTATSGRNPILAQWVMIVQMHLNYTSHRHCRDTWITEVWTHKTWQTIVRWKKNNHKLIVWHSVWVIWRQLVDKKS